MSSTILTVIVLVVMWIVVLVPMFTRREDASESTVERFSSAMRSLGRPSETDSDETAEDSESEPEERESEPEPEPVVQRPMPAARAQMLARRRRTLGTLISLTLITVLLAVGWRAQFWLVNAVFDVLLVGYLWWLRQEARREQERRARRAARARSVAHATRVARPEPEQAAPVDERPAFVAAPVGPRASYVQDEPLRGPINLDEQDATLSEDFDDDYPTMEIQPPRAVGE